MLTLGRFKGVNMTGNAEVSSEIKWHMRFLNMAQQVSLWSKDRSTKVGAVVVKDRRVVATGYNGFPEGVNDLVEERHGRPAKYLYTEHAERNCVFQAARQGVSLEGATLYLNYAPMPCADCTRAVIQSGIDRIVTSTVEFPGISKEMWDGHFKASKEMLEEAGIEVIAVPMSPFEHPFPTST
jgi:dCMP deaminase